MSQFSVKEKLGAGLFQETGGKRIKSRKTDQCRWREPLNDQGASDGEARSWGTHTFYFFLFRYC